VPERKRNLAGRNRRSGRKHRTEMVKTSSIKVERRSVTGDKGGRKLNRPALELGRGNEGGFGHGLRGGGNRGRDGSPELRRNLSWVVVDEV